MFDQDNTDPAYKKAAIDWLLSVGQCESMTESTGLVLAQFKVRGVDYERSEMPRFGSAMVEPGDSFTEATYADAVSASIMPIGGREWRDEHTFVIPPEDWKHLMLGAIIRGIVTANSEGAEGKWQARAYEKEVEAILAADAREVERQRLLAERAERDKRA